MEPKGFVVCKTEFIATKMWPDSRYSFTEGTTDLEKEYKEALAGKQVVVMDIGVDGACYLVYAKTKKGQPFIWSIEKADTVNGSFLALKWKCGTLMPANLSPIEEAGYIMRSVLAKDKYQKP